MARVGTAYVSIRAKLDKLDKDLNDAKRLTETRARQTQQAVSDIFKGVAAYFGARELVQFGKAVFDTGRQVARLEKSFQAITGSTVTANAEFQFLRKTSDELGQNFYDLAETYKGFLASSKNTVLQGREARELFVALTRASASLGLTSYDTEGALRAVSQMMSKGKIAAEELRQQLGERLYGAFNLVAKAAGVSTAELDKMLQEGRVSIEVLKRFTEVLNSEYTGEVDAATRSVNKLAESWMDLKKSVSESGFMDVAVSGIQKLTDVVKASSEALKGMKAAYDYLFTGENIDKSLKGSGRKIARGYITQATPGYDAYVGNQTMPNAPAGTNAPVLSQGEIEKQRRAAEARQKFNDFLDQQQLDSMYSVLLGRDQAQEAADEMDALIRESIESGNKLYLEQAQERVAIQSRAAAAIVEAERSTSKHMIELSQYTAEAMQDSFATFFFDVMKGEFKDLGDYATGLLDSINRSISQMMSQELIKKLFGSSVSGGSGSGWISSAVSWLGSLFGGASAKGNVFSTAGMVPFANGGIVGSPTVFPFARGVGLMGEAGPEAIMPLRRNSRGELGVSGGAGPSVTIQIQAIDTQSGAQFLERNMPVIAQKLRKELQHSPGLSRSYNV